MNVVTLRGTTDIILRELYKSPTMSDIGNNKLRLTEAAANLVISNIRAIVASNEFSPDHADITAINKNLDYLHDSLRYFSNNLF